MPLFTSLLILLLVALPAQTSPHPPYPTVARIVARHIAARGGSERLRRIRTLRLAGRILLPSGMLGADTIEMARPLRIRTTMHFAGATLVQAYDGHTAWGTSPFQGDTTPRPLEAENARNVIAGADLDGPLMNYRAKGNRVTLMGVDTADGRLRHLLSRLPPGERRDDGVPAGLGDPGTARSDAHPVRHGGDQPAD